MDMTSLQDKLIKSKAVMNKVDGLSPSNLPSDPTALSPNIPPINNNFNMDSIKNVIKEGDTKPPVVTEDRINNSNLPDAIKKLMIDHPIPEVSFGNTVAVSDSIIQGAAEKMNKLGMSTNIPSPKLEQSTRATTINRKSATQKLSQKNLKNLIKNVVSESLDELIETKITKIISESRTTNENIQIRVGNTILEGKITSTRDLS